MHREVFPLELRSFHVWRQTETQSVINNYIEEDNCILRPRKNDRGDGDGIFRKEFPVMQWVFAQAHILLGRDIAVSRALSFILGLLCLFFFFGWLRTLFRNDILAAAGTWALHFSPAFYYYIVCPLPDNLALASALAGLFLWERSVQRQHKGISFYLSTALFSLSALAKLPFILFFVYPATELLLEGRRTGHSLKYLRQTLLYCLPAILPLGWYAWVIPTWEGNGIVQGMLENKVSAGQLFDYLLHNVVSVVPELLLNYASVPFFLCGLWVVFIRKGYRHPRFLPIAMCGLAMIAYFLFELNMIAKVHDYYLFPMLPFMFLLVVLGLRFIWSAGYASYRGIALCLLLVLPLSAWLRIQPRWRTGDLGFNPDLLHHRKTLRNAVPGNALVIAGSDPSTYIFLYYIDKKGWALIDDQVDSLRLAGMIRSGAQYWYTDQQITDRPEFMPYIDREITRAGSIGVYRLKLP